MARTRLYRNGVLDAEGFGLGSVSQHLTDASCVVWVDLYQPSEDDLRLIADELQLHDLAVEHALEPHDRPKVDRYRSHLFLTAYQAHLDAPSGRLVLAEVSAFVTHQALVTVRKSPDFDIDAVVERWDGAPDLVKYGPSFLLHGLLDQVVDTQFDAVQALDDAMDGLEDMLFDDRPKAAEVQRRSFQLRKSLVVLRRVVLPMREVLDTLLRRDGHVLDEAMVPYFQDVYDHVLRATEWTESLRDLVTTILETNVTIQGNRLNTIMKKVTSWAAIIAVPTAVTGYYGQNVPYPGFAAPAGFWTSTAAIAVLSGTLYVVFKRRDWL